jgi:hypothetical protein
MEMESQAAQRKKSHPIASPGANLSAGAISYPAPAASPRPTRKMEQFSATAGSYSAPAASSNDKAQWTPDMGPAFANDRAQWIPNGRTPDMAQWTRPAFDNDRAQWTHPAFANDRSLPTKERPAAFQWRAILSGVPYVLSLLAEAFWD